VGTVQQRGTPAAQELQVIRPQPRSTVFRRQDMVRVTQVRLIKRYDPTAQRHKKQPLNLQVLLLLAANLQLKVPLQRHPAHQQLLNPSTLKDSQTTESSAKYL
jgi:hypothetical protein